MLSLEAFRREVGWNPYHFWGLANELVPIESSCKALVQQYNWQATDAIGRAEIQEAILRAEDKLQEHLGYAVGRRWTTVDVSWPDYFQSGAEPWWAGAIALPNEGYIGSFGVETRTPIQLGATVVLTDTNSDGVLDTFTITAATTVTDATQIALFVPAANQVLDRTQNGEDWHITPIRTTITGGFATITGASWLLIRPVLYEGVATSANGLDPNDATNYLSTMDVYQVVSGGSHGAAYYDYAPYPQWCCPSISDPAAVAYTDIRAGVVHPLFGTINPVVSVQNTTTLLWTAANTCSCRPPDRVRLNVYAGVPRANTYDLDPYWQRVVARLAIAEIQGEPCGCEAANHVWAYWQQDVSRTSGPDQYAFKETALNNPFGVKRGHIEAWHAVLRKQHIQALSIQ